MSAAELRDLLVYHRWARSRVLAVAEALAPAEFTRTLASSHPSVRDTLLHVLWADWIWTRRLHGLSPRIVFDRDDYPDVARLREKWAEVDGDLDRLLAGLDDAGCERAVEYRDLRGNPQQLPLWVILRQVVNHGSYHRGQAVTLLRALGRRDLPATDLVAWWRAGRPSV